MKNEEQQKEWLEINKIRKKLVLLRYGTEDDLLTRHYSLAIWHLEDAQKHLKSQIEP
jgi:hypothetical protein